MKCLTVYQCMDLHFLVFVLVRGDILLAVVCVAWGVILLVVLCVVWVVILFVVRCVDLLMIGLDVGILVLLPVVGGIGGVGNSVVV